MSFSSELKTELCKAKVSGCCEYAELYGIFLLSRNFSNADIFFFSDRKDITDKTAHLIKSVYNISVEGIMFNGNYALKSDILSVGQIYADFITTEYITDVFSCENCFEAFMRGAFLSAGTITDPQKGFHAEIKTKNENVAISLENMLQSKRLNAHISMRKGYFVVYFKGNESVSDFLALMGASKKALEVIDIALMNDMRNKVNRLQNCENANMDKMVNAAVRQKLAIKKLMDCGRFSTLTDELKTAANLRIENPEMSLNDLSKICGLSRSGLNHRLGKLVEIADSIEDKAD